MVSKASEDFPEPLRPVMTTSLSRGIWSVRSLRLCSRAPPILMNSLLTSSNFPIQTIEKPSRDLKRCKGEPLKNVRNAPLEAGGVRIDSGGEGSPGPVKYWKNS